MLEAAFPRLRETGYRLTSAASPRYNCIAWAARVVDQWWWPAYVAPYYWPPDIQRTETVECFVEAFGLQGYEPCSNDELEPGFEKIALYAANGVPTHAARQLPSGAWTSKLGDAVDIEHNTLSALDGTLYGSAVLILRRPRQP